MTTTRSVLRRLRFVIPMMALAAAGAGLYAAPPTFATQRLINTFANGLLPFDVRTEDIDQNGDLDIYTANYSGRISWFENDGGHPPGAWAEHILTEFADGTESVYAARVDGDADIDFFSAAFNLEEIAWYENGGDGKSWTRMPITFDCRLCVDVWGAEADRGNDPRAGNRLLLRRPGIQRLRDRHLRRRHFGGSTGHRRLPLNRRPSHE
jgi:hypothetical protein